MRLAAQTESGVMCLKSILRHGQGLVVCAYLVAHHFVALICRGLCKVTAHLQSEMSCTLLSMCTVMPKHRLHVHIKPRNGSSSGRFLRFWGIGASVIALSCWQASHDR